MDAETIAWIVGSVLTALGLGGAGGRYLLPRYGGAQGEPQPAGATNPGIVNTGQTKALNVVTESECRETRKDLTDSFEKTSDKIERALGSATDSIQALTTTVTKLEAKVDAIPMEIENASMKATQAHETRFHGRPATGGYPKVGSGGK